MLFEWLFVAAVRLGETPTALPDEAPADVAMDRAHSPSEEPVAETQPEPVRDRAPRLGLVDSPYGLPARAGFAGVTGDATWQRNANTLYTGALTLAVAPIDRVTLGAVLGRDEVGRYSPSATLHVRFLGDLAHGGALGALARYKAEGFSELGGEAELGLTAGARAGHFGFVADFVGGAGLEQRDSGELDTEALVAASYDLSDVVRVGVEGQGRERVSGRNTLAGGRRADARGGPMLVLELGPVLLALEGGATTRAVAEGIGAYGLVTVASVVR